MTQKPIKQKEKPHFLAYQELQMPYYAFWSVYYGPQNNSQQANTTNNFFKSIMLSRFLDWIYSQVNDALYICILVYLKSNLLFKKSQDKKINCHYVEYLFSHNFPPDPWYALTRLIVQE